MRLWSFAPRILDRKGIGGQWVEALLAKTVLFKESGGYSNHPQLNRFRACANGDVALDSFLHNVWREATQRGYNYNIERLGDHKVPDCPACRNDSDVTLTHIPDEAAVATPPETKKLSATGEPLSARTMAVTVGQVCYEWRSLLRKLKTRDEARYALLRRIKLVFGSRRAFCKNEIVEAGLLLYSAGGASYYVWGDQTRVVQLPPTGIDWIPAISEATDTATTTAAAAPEDDSTWLDVRPEDTCGSMIGEGEWTEHEPVFSPEVASRAGALAESCPLGGGEREVTVHAELLLHHVFRVVAGGVEEWEIAYTREREEREGKTTGVKKDGKKGTVKNDEGKEKVPRKRKTAQSVEEGEHKVNATPRKRKAETGAQTTPLGHSERVTRSQSAKTRKEQG